MRKNVTGAVPALLRCQQERWLPQREACGPLVARIRRPVSDPELAEQAVQLTGEFAKSLASFAGLFGR